MSGKFSVTVVGGANMDIGGSVTGELRLRDSNIGHIGIKPGGVGRNIAHDLCLLGLDVRLIAAVGGDLFGAGLLESCRELGMDMSLAPVFPDERSSCYLYVNDCGGDMRVAVNDMGITERITPEHLEKCLDKINRCDAVVLDANLTEEAIGFLAENCAAPLYADPVSCAKALRLKNALPKLTALKPNAMEAETLTGEKEPEKAARALLRMGVKRVFVSLGAEGIVAAEGDTLLRLPSEKAAVVNTTGAGDAATAAIVWAGVRGLSLEATAQAALKAAALTCESESANCERLRDLSV